MQDEPRFVIVDSETVPWVEVLAQQHGLRRVSVHNRFLEWTPNRMVDWTRYDPGVIIERHGHASDHLVLVCEGQLTIGERTCSPGTLIILEAGAVFGPLIAGPDGALLFEVWTGDPRSVPADPEGHAKLLTERGIKKLPVAPLVRPASAGRREP
jgi:hypothetical protein